MATFYAKYPSTSVTVAISGTTNVQGTGTAGAQAGGVLTVQGDPAGTPIPVTGTFANPSVSTTGTAVPASATMIGGTDGTNLRAAHVSAAGLVSVDGSGVTQPVSAAALPLPTGAATEATLAAQSAKLPATLGQKAMAASMAVVIASDQSAVPASQSGTWNITNVSGTVSLPTGAATGAKQDTGNTSVASIDTKTPALGQAAMASSVPVVIASNQSAVPVSGTVAATQSGTWTVQPGNTPNTTAWKVDGSAVTQPVSGTVTANAGTGTLTVDQTTATATFDAEGTIAFGSLTTSYVTAYTAGGVLKILQMRNSMNQSVLVSLDGGTTLNYTLDPGDYVSLDLKENGLSFANASTVKAKYTGTAPTSGNFRVNGVR